MVPLAPLGDLPADSPPEAALTRVLRRIDERLQGELPTAEAKRLLMAAWILIGMRVGRSKLKLLKENMEMVDLRDSNTYWMILEEGMEQGKAEGKVEGRAEGKVEGRVEGLAEGLRTMLLEVGARRLGSPTAEVQALLGAINDTARLHRIGQRVLEVGTWQELLETA